MITQFIVFSRNAVKIFVILKPECWNWRNHLFVFYCKFYLECKLNALINCRFLVSINIRNNCWIAVKLSKIYSYCYRINIRNLSFGIFSKCWAHIWKINMLATIGIVWTASWNAMGAMDTRLYWTINKKLQYWKSWSYLIRQKVGEKVSG